jgi:hypothetical protein
VSFVDPGLYTRFGLNGDAVAPQRRVTLRSRRVSHRGWRWIAIVVTVLAACHGDGAKCGGSGAAAKAPSTGFCASCSAPAAAGELARDAIGEASGVAASAIHDGIFYVHNDSGDRSRFFAVDRAGADRGTFEVSGAKNGDWEDMAKGPCADGTSCLYFADFGGGKDKERATGTIYRVPEPAEIGAGTHTVEAESFVLTYPDGAHDSETLLVHPTTGIVTLVTKVKSGPSSIYEAPGPLAAGATVVLVKRGTLEPPHGSAKITGGSVHPRGEGILIRTYSDVFFYALGPDEAVAHALGGKPCAMPAPPEEKGEAVSWLASGKGFVLVGEGRGARLRVSECSPPLSGTGG